MSDLVFGTVLSFMGIQLLKTGVETFTNYLNITPFVGGKRDTNFSENKRGNFTYGEYPPCFQYSFEAQQIYDNLKKNNKLDEYHQLLDVYSILLCQKYHASYKQCNSNMLKDRITDVKAMMGNQFDKPTHMTKLSKYVKLDNSDISNLILYSFVVIEKNIKKLNDELITTFNNRFYLNNLAELQMLCSR